ncbi:MAG: ubiquinol-cytochrome c reductase iron-sulfur subunit [Thaumarchaeota archaeon]|nr:ubiquinol-cytochrome c reductase iron-sulfur subunit [Nitrososphaerota archaeon]
METVPCNGASGGKGPGTFSERCASCRLRQARSSGNPSRLARKSISKSDAGSGLERVQQVMGVSFLLSTLSGCYLLATDGSLWHLAVSHAYGLIVIVLIDAVLGIMNLLSKRAAYVPSLAAAALGFLLQVGDVATAPQYNMTVPYFASYLFGLWAYDALLALQVAVILAGVFGRTYASHLARVRRGRGGKQLNYSRRDFVKAFAALSVVIGAAVTAASVKLPAPQQQTAQASTSSLANGAIANTNQLQVGSPVYFEYPSGYPNILMKNSDGTLTALSMLCTHVCCECSYDSASSQIYCPCHGSVFDATGRVLRGPAQTPLPSIELTVDSTTGLIYPKAIKGTGPCLP